MVTYTYTLFLTSQNSSLSPSNYAVDLTEEEENNPSKKIGEQRQNIRETLQKKTAQLIDDEYLEIIIKAWAQDIKEGYRDTSLTLDLPFIEQEVGKAENSHQQPSNLVPQNINENVAELIPPYLNKDIPDLVPPDIRDVEPNIGALPPLDF